ncbi:MAG: hypothetical protein AB1401_00455 [Thermodesulfobacteriota bacterium]
MEWLIETLPARLEIVEEATEANGGRMKVRGKFQEADVINGNGRVYPRKILKREVERLKQDVAERRAFGEGDHPKDGRSTISGTVSILTDIDMPDNEVFGEAIILNTAKGKDLQEIIRAGGRVGVSSRGSGTTKRGRWNGEMADEVGEDFRLKTFDFVIGASVKGAEVGSYTEQQLDVINILSDSQRELGEEQKGEKEEVMKLGELKEKYPELVKQLDEEVTARVTDEITKKVTEEVTKRLSDDFDKKVTEAIDQQRQEIVKQVRVEIEGSPEFKAGNDVLRKIIESVKPLLGENKADDTDDENKKIIEGLKASIEEQEKKIEKLDNQVKSLTGQLSEEKSKVEVKAYIEEKTKGEVLRNSLMERLGDCKTKEEVDERLPKEKEAIKKVIDESKRPPGHGKVLDEDKEEKGLTENQKRQRRAAGIKEKSDK